jgi:hypothetical protein
MYYVVNQPVANTAGETTVTFTYAGVVIGVKTFKFVGDIATLTVSSDAITSFVNGVFDATEAAAAAKAPSARLGVVYIAKDAAGNAVTLAAQPTVTSATGSMVGATVAAVGAASTLQVLQSSSVGYGATTMYIPATTLNGTGTYKLKITNAAGVEISSAAQTVRVSNGGPDSFVASWDKASYAPGDIAVLTITVKDVYKNLVGFGTPLPGLTASLLVSTAGFTAIGGTCVDASYTDSLGVKTCKFAAGNTEGAYSFNLDLDTTTAQAATVGALKIVASSATVSNAQVLQSIVALIASINKQIQALQALILKKK